MNTPAANPKMIPQVSTNGMALPEIESLGTPTAAQGMPYPQGSRLGGRLWLVVLRVMFLFRALLFPVIDGKRSDVLGLGSVELRVRSRRIHVRGACRR